MLEILSNSLVQFLVTVIVALVGIIVSVILEHRRKAVSYEVLSHIPLLSWEDELRKRMQILFEGKPVEDVSLFSYKFINSGNVPIASADYEVPISVNFGENARVLTAEITQRNPDNLCIPIQIKGTYAVLLPALLNPKDWIKINLLVSKASKQPRIDGRIVGVRSISETPEIPSRIWVFLTIAVVAETISFALLQSGPPTILYYVLGGVVLISVLSEVPEFMPSFVYGDAFS